MNTLSAVLFDLDGTIAPTEPLHWKAWRETFEEHGLDIDEAFYKRHVSGRATPATFRDHFLFLSPEEVRRGVRRKEARFRELVRELRPMPGLLALLDWASGRGLRRAIVTNSPARQAVFLLSTLGLRERFSLVLSSEESRAAKPSPAPYLMALERLGLSPESAIAFEDSPSGIHSSVAAGIHTVAIASSQEPRHLQAAGASMVIPDFTSRGLLDHLRCLL
jgi:HAD superfamily hydrolase (TIGR01509 family)